MRKRQVTASASGEVEDVDDDEYDPATAESSEEPVRKKTKTKGVPKGVGKAPQPFENGVVTSLVLENFMNHEHMRVDLDPHVNFIIGKNGSGKSAIVAGLIAGLSCKAKVTGRNTNSYSTLIMHGKPEAVIRVHLANGGEDPYEPERFGDTVVVEHTLETKGGGSYKLLRADGTLIKRSSKKEIEELCSFFNIQAANPCALLTQEAAKKFLHQGNDGDRYKFFLQAANLASQQEDLAEARAALVEMRERIVVVEADIEERLQPAAEEAREEYDGAKTLQQMQHKKEKMEPMIAWGAINDKDKELAQLRAALEQAKAAREAQRAEFDAHQTAVQKATEDTEAIEREVEALDAKVEEASNEGKKAMAVARELKQKLKDSQAGQKRAEADRVQAQSEVEEAEAEQERALADLEKNAKSVAAKKARERQALEQQLGGADASESDLQQRIAEANGRYKQAAAEKERLNPLVQEAKAEQRDEEERLKRLKQAKGKDEGLEEFHPDMPRLVQLVDQARRQGQFKGQVVGPIGKHIKMREGKEHHAPAVEVVLGVWRGLCKFVVEYSDDANVVKRLAVTASVTKGGRHAGAPLRPLMHRVEVANMKNKTRRHTPQMIAEKRPNSHYPTVDEVVEVENDLVYNCVCDTHQFGAMLLIPSQDEAHAEFNKKGKHGVQTANAKTVHATIEEPRKNWPSYTIKGDQSGGGYRGLNQRYEKDTPPGLLEMSKGAALEQAAAAVARAKEEVDVQGRALKQAEAAASKELQEEKKLRQELKRRQTAHGQMRQQLDNLRYEMEDADGDGGALAAARDELERATAAVKAAQADEERNGRAADDARKKYEPKKARVDAHKRDFDRYASGRASDTERPPRTAPQLTPLLFPLQVHRRARGEAEGGGGAEAAQPEAEAQAPQAAHGVQGGGRRGEGGGEGGARDEGLHRREDAAGAGDLRRPRRRRRGADGAAAAGGVREDEPSAQEAAGEARREVDRRAADDGREARPEAEREARGAQDRDPNKRGEREGAEGAVQVLEDTGEAEVAAGERRLQHVPQQEAARRRVALRPRPRDLRPRGVAQQPGRQRQVDRRRA